MMGTTMQQRFTALDKQVAVRRILLGRSTLEEEAKKRKIGVESVSAWCADPEIRGDIPITLKSNWKPPAWSRRFKEKIAARVAKGESPASIAREVSGLTPGQVRRWSMGLDMDDPPEPVAAKAEKPETEELFPSPPQPPRHPQRDEAVKAYRGGMMPSEIIKALDLKVTADCIRDWEAEDRAAGKYSNPANRFGKRSEYTDEQQRAAAERWAKGESASVLAKELGCSDGAIYHWAENRGIKRSPELAARARSEGARRGWGLEVTDEQRHRAVARWAAGESADTIAADYGVSRTAINDWAKQLGVERRAAQGSAPTPPPPAPVTNRNGHHGPPVPTPALETPAPAPAKATPPPVAPQAPTTATGGRKIQTVQSYACPHCWEPVKLPPSIPGALIVTAGLCPTCKGEIEL